jgi:GcrA cell cycle regulator
MHDWNESEVGDLRRMCAEGLSARVIATELGITRNAVIGKVARMGLHLPGPEPKPKPKGKRSHHRQPKPKPLGSPHPWRAKPALAPWVPQPRVRFPEPSRTKHGQPELRSAPRLITELTEDVCHWPMWSHQERDIRAKLYCGGMAIEGSKYCPHHAWLNSRGSVA